MPVIPETPEEMPELTNLYVSKNWILIPEMPEETPEETPERKRSYVSKNRFFSSCPETTMVF